MSNTQEQGYICPRTNLQCDDECCVNPMDCHIKAGEKVFLSNNKQSSVEWLVEQMFKQGYFDGNKPLIFTNLDHLQQQAKVMHKLEMIQFALFWSHEYANRDVIEKEYNETFGGIHE
jgi:hypothetical protein